MEKTINKEKVSDTIHTILDVGVGMLKKDALNRDDFSKMKVMKAMAPPLTAAIGMFQQENAQEKVALIRERMIQMGYDVPKEIG